MVTWIDRSTEVAFFKELIPWWVEAFSQQSLDAT
jgi:hypothetical protein